MTAPSTVNQAVANSEPWIQRFARVGYAAKGVIYMLIGVFALMAANGWGGKKTNQAGAINSIANIPFGQVLLVLIAAGLLGYALWRIVQAIYDPEDNGAIKRIAYVVSAIAYGGIGWAALTAALAGDRAQQNSQGTVARVLDMPMGSLLVMAASAIFFVVGAIQIVNGLTGKFTKVLKRHEMSDEQMALARWTGGLGLVARGTLFGVIGWFLWRAATHDNPREAGGIDRALAAIAQSPFGTTLLAMMAVGLICYGIYMWVMARFREMRPATAASPAHSSATR